MKKWKGRHGRPLLAGLFLFFTLFLMPGPAQAAVTVKENGEYYMTDSQAEAPGEPLYGRLSINYTGNSNYSARGDIQHNQYKSTDDAYKAALKVLQGETSVLGTSGRTTAIRNSSTARLRKSTWADGTFQAAYLVWTTRTSANRTAAEAKTLAKCPVALVLPDGSAKKITAEYASYDDRCVNSNAAGWFHQKTFVCMYRDVTDLVNEAGYGTYGVCNIPYYQDGGGGLGDGGWQLIVVENNPGEDIRAVRLKMQAKFNIEDVSKHGGNWVETDIKAGLHSKCKSKAYLPGDDTRITGQYFFLYQSSSKENDYFDKSKSKFRLYGGTESEEWKAEKEIFKINMAQIFPGMMNNGEYVSREGTTLKSELLDFVCDHDEAPKAYSQKDFTFQANAGDVSYWMTMFVTGFSIDIADSMAEGEQVTTVNSASSVTVSQTITNVSRQEQTGYYNGDLVVELDENLSPSGIPELIVHDKRNNLFSVINGFWNASDRTVTFSDSRLKSPESGWSISYSIDCTVQRNSGAKKFTNGFMLSGDLRSQGENTDVYIEDLFSGESDAVPMYTLTVRMDRDTMEKITSKQGKNRADKTLGTVGSQSAVVTDSAGKTWNTASYDVTWNHYISSAPSLLTGCDFVKWVELMGSTGVTTDRKVSSKYVNDSTLAYERQMPASDLTISAVGKLHFYDLTLTAGYGVRSVSGGGKYAYRSPVTIDASLLPGYHWKNWTGTWTLGDRKYSFEMPAQNVALTAEGEANAYTIRFDPDTGKEVAPVPDITTAYDRKVTLPDATGSYVRFTLDGEDITQQVLDGVIVLDENGVAMTAEEAEALAREAEEAAADPGDGSGESAELSGRTETGEEPVLREMQPEGAEETEGQEKPAETGEDEREPDVSAQEDAKTEPAPHKKAYASVFTGWCLEDGRGTYVPRWKHGQEMNASVIADAAGMTDVNGAVITLYAVWDDCPWIVAEDLYYTLEQARSGQITEAEILSYQTAYDREDGSPVAPGTNPALNRPEVFTSFGIPDFRPEAFTGLSGDGSCTETLSVTDSAGSVYKKTIGVHVVDTTPQDVPPPGTTRFIDEYYYQQTYENGGLEDDSVWKADPEYAAVLNRAFENLRNGTPEETYHFSRETILEMKEYIREHGHGNTREPHALTGFYDRFMAPNRIR